MALGSGCGSQEATEPRSAPFFDGDTVTLEIAGETVVAAVADTLAERSLGLSGVEDLGELDGMLFVFDAPRQLRFNMENTLIPLDVWFIDSSGRIVGSAKMEPCSADPCPRYPSPGDAAWGLETRTGDFEFAVGELVVGLLGPS